MKEKNLIKQLCEQLIFLLVGTADMCQFLCEYFCVAVYLFLSNFYFLFFLL